MSCVRTFPGTPARFRQVPQGGKLYLGIGILLPFGSPPNADDMGCRDVPYIQEVY